MKSAKINSIRLLAMSLIAICSFTFSAAQAQAQAQNRNVLLVNQSSLTLVKFYASNVGTNDWQEDILGLGVLAPGYYVNVNIDDGSGYCHFDLKAAFSNGHEIIRRNVDVCAVRSWTIGDRWNLFE